MYRQLERLETEPSESPNYTYADFNDYIQFAEVFKNFSDDAFSNKTGVTEENKLKIALIPKMLKTINRIALNKVTEKLNEGEVKDITADLLETDAFSGIFKQLQDYDAEVFKRMAKMVEVAQDNIRREFNKVHAVMQERDQALKKWSKENGISQFDAFRKIYNEETRSLVPKFNSSYIKKLKEAKKNRKIAWLTANTTFNKERFEENRDGYFSFLDKTYTEKGDQALKEKLKNDWLRKYDVEHFPSTAYTNFKNYYLGLVDNPEFYSDQWKEMLKPENKPLKDYYDQYVAFNEHFNKLVGRKIRRGFVAEIRQDTIDRISQVGIGAIGNLGKYLAHALEVREGDITEREIDPVTKKPVPIIPLLFTDPVRDLATTKEIREIEEELEKEDYIKGTESYQTELTRRVNKLEYKKGAKFKSIDLTRSLLLFAETVYTNKFYNDTVDQIKSIQHLMKSDRIKTKIKTKLTDTTGKPLKNLWTGTILKSLGVPRSDLEIFDRFVNMYWYGLDLQTMDKGFKGRDKVDSEGKVISKGKTYSRNKVFNIVSKITTYKALPLNLVAGIGNIIGMYSNLKIVAAEGILFNNKQIDKAIALMLGMNKKALMTVAYFEPSSRNLAYEKANKLSAGILSKLLTADRIMSLFRKPDDWMDGTILIGMMQNHGIDKDGNVQRLKRLPEGTKSLYELAEIKDNKFVMPKEFNEESFRAFRKLVRTGATSIKGVTSEDNKNQIGVTIFMRAINKFRSWIPGLAKARFKKGKLNENMKELDPGRYRVIAGEFIRTPTFQEGLKNVGRLVAETIIRTPILSKVTGNLSAYDKGQNDRAAQIYFERYMVENPEDRGKITLEEYKEERAAKLKGAARELSSMLFFFAVAGLLKSLIPDDDEEIIEEFFAKNSYKFTNRGLLELTFWVNPESVLEIIKSPVPDFKTITDLEIP
jgi:hypothetical protein